MMDVLPSTAGEVRQAGAEYGQDLAGALFLALERGGGGTELKRELAAIVLREIGAEVKRLRESAMSDALLKIFELACREGCREALLGGLARSGAARIAA
jgi:hypothetical protein